MSGSMLGKSSILVDATTPANGDSIAAYLTSAASLLITSTTFGGKEYLDVKNLGAFAEDSAHTTGDFGQFVLGVRNDANAVLTSADGDYSPIAVDSAGRLRAIVAGVFAEDSAHSSGDDGSHVLAVRKDAQGSNVSADGDYSSLQTWSEGSLKVVDIANGTMLQQQISVTTTAAQLPATNLANRKSILIQNASTLRSFWVGSATVTASGATAGIEVPKGGFIELEIGPDVDVYAITATSTANANVLELA